MVLCVESGYMMCWEKKGRYHREAQEEMGLVIAGIGEGRGHQWLEGCPWGDSLGGWESVGEHLAALNNMLEMWTLWNVIFLKDFSQREE